MQLKHLLIVLLLLAPITLSAATKKFQVDTGGTLTNGLVSYWKMEDATDYYGTNDLTNSGYSFVAGKVNNAASSTDANTNLTKSSPSGVDNLTTFTVAFWVRPQQAVTGASWNIIGRAVSADYMWGLQLNYPTDTGNARVYLNQWQSTGNDYRHFGSATGLSQNVWTHVVAIFTPGGSASNIFINGTGDATTTAAGVGTWNTNSATRNFQIGQQEGPGTNGLVMDIDEVGFWNRALTPQEITDLYNSGNGQTMTAGTQTSFLDFAAGLVNVAWGTVNIY